MQIPTILVLSQLYTTMQYIRDVHNKFNNNNLIKVSSNKYVSYFCSNL